MDLADRDYTRRLSVLSRVKELLRTASTEKKQDTLVMLNTKLSGESNADVKRYLLELNGTLLNEALERCQDSAKGSLRPGGAHFLETLFLTPSFSQPLGLPPPQNPPPLILDHICHHMGLLLSTATIWELSWRCTTMNL